MLVLYKKDGLSVPMLQDPSSPAICLLCGRILADGRFPVAGIPVRLTTGDRETAFQVDVILAI